MVGQVDVTKSVRDGELCVAIDGEPVRLRGMEFGDIRFAQSHGLAMSWHRDGRAVVIDNRNMASARVRFDDGLCYFEPLIRPGARFTWVTSPHWPFLGPDREMPPSPAPRAD